MAELLHLECVAFRYVDWPALLNDLVKSGWNLPSIAEALNIPETTVKNWLYAGKEPRYSNGDALILLHRKVFGDDWTLKSLAAQRARAINAPARIG